MDNYIEEGLEIDELQQFLTEDFQLVEHSVRVMKLACGFGETLNLSEKDKIALRAGSYMHDIGKIKVNKEILNKPGKLNDEEFEEIKRHSLEGFNILKRYNFIDKDVLDIALQHHERNDGNGYPLGLKGAEINHLAKIVQLCDVFEALTAQRCYKEAMDVTVALSIIEENLDTQFDMELGVAFIEFIKYGSQDESKVNQLGA